MAAILDNSRLTTSFFPTLRPLSFHYAGLKETTQQFLALHSLRTRPHPLLVDEPVLEPYIPQVHGVDVLLAIWYAATQAGEHRRVFAQYGQSPSLFVTSASQTELVVLVQAGAAWKTGDGVLALANIEDVVEGGRGRLNFYTLPAYRQPTLTRRLARMVLEHLFVTRGYQLVYGLTPVQNRVAVRFALRLGFRHNGIWPSAIWYDGHISDAVHTQLMYKEWEQNHAVRQ